MTRSIFDPTANPEHSGSGFTGPDAKEISQLPPRFNEEVEEEASQEEADEDLATDTKATEGDLEARKKK